MPVVNMHEAKTHLAEIVRRVQQGEVFIIARAGQPVAQVVRLGTTPIPRRAAGLRGVRRFDEAAGMPAAIHAPDAAGNRPAPRWRAFPWGGTSGGGSAD